jgi:hypothetical protein
MRPKHPSATGAVRHTRDERLQDERVDDREEEVHDERGESRGSIEAGGATAVRSTAGLSVMATIIGRAPWAPAEENGTIAF